MRRLACLLALLVLLPATAGAQTADSVGAADRTAIIDVIGSQIEAFRADRATEAFSYASPAIQRMFGDPQTFMDMVRTGYRPVYRPRTVEFLDLVDTPGGLTQRVLFVGPDGTVVIAHYFMQRQPDGSWKINGVQLTRGEAQAA